eukprot:jgi/Mesen1/3316/ME000191S02459
MNKAQFLTRMGPGPVIPGLPTVLPKTVDWIGCRDLSDLGDFVRCVDLNIHGGPHAWTAGNRGLPTFAEKQAEVDCTHLDTFGPSVCKDTFDSFAFLGLFGRGIFRVDGCLICDKTCTLDQPVENCNCQCSAEVSPHARTHICITRHTSTWQIPQGGLICALLWRAWEGP